MRRRNFLVVLGTTGIWLSAARAQRSAVRLVGYLNLAAPGPAAPFVAAFRQGLAEAGYIETKNLAIEYRWADYQSDRLPALAADLVARNVEIIVTGGGPLAALAAKRATSKIPIVFTAVGDPVANGLVASLARPGGNVTGLSILVVELNAKRLDLLSELVPQAKVIALMANPNGAEPQRIVNDVQEAAHAKGLRLLVLQAGTETEICVRSVAWHRAMLFRPSMSSAKPWPPAAWPATDPARSSSVTRRVSTREGFSRESSPRTCWCSSPPRSNWRSI